MAAGVSALKFVGTISLGLLTGISASVSAFTLPTLRQLDSSASASRALSHLASTIQLPLLALSSLSAAPLLLSFALSPRHARHPYLFYTSALAALSALAPTYIYLPQRVHSSSSSSAASPPSSSRHSRRESPRVGIDASYEVLGDVRSEGDAEEEQRREEGAGAAGVNGEEVGQIFDAAARASFVRTVLAAAGFAMSVVGIWGDAAPSIVIRA
ncbi:Autophagy-related protein 33 [Escovopsis weberi]|uniref:Autophagy-related protein 33 n=1 Tax=Escovopsis weberi TaxID=150374 RepID=A0A0N0RSX2_ESCWE|nr:Autophagy-related protein 33 [Escovopsis weberi]